MPLSGLEAVACGINLRPDSQARLLRNVFPAYADEVNAFPLRAVPGRFYLDNEKFAGIDPHVYHCLLRHFRPRTVVEVGCGHSTLLAFRTLEANGPGARLIAVDPCPPEHVRELAAGPGTGLELIPRRVETLDLDLFLGLRENDVLFVDGSHVVRAGGDVCFLVLEVLPRLAPGVLVHFHDVFIPYDYPAQRLSEDETRWTEQYLLQAHLAENDRVEVLFASYYIAREHPELVKAAFPNAMWWSGESFWMQRSRRPRRE